MHPRMIWAIFNKDLRDAIRDARVLVAVVVPLGLGLFYNFVFDDDDFEGRASATMAYVAAEETTLPETLREFVSVAVDLDLEEVGNAEEVRRLVADEEVDLGLIIPAGFDAAVEAGEAPSLSLILPETTGFGADYVAATLDSVLREMADQEPPALIQVERSVAVDADLSVFDELGIRTYLVLVTIVFVVVMISMLALPVILAEEAEKKTLDALVMIASYQDVIVAKALVGLTYIVVAIAIQMALTRLAPSDVLTFVAGLLLLSIALIGFGLLLGSLFRNANQLNTWSGFLLMPVIAPVFLVGMPMPDTVETILMLIPTSQGTRLAINGFSGETIFADAWLSYLVIAAWGAVAYALLLRHLARRQA